MRKELNKKKYWISVFRWHKKKETYRARTSKLLKTTWRKLLLLSEAPIFCNEVLFLLLLWRTEKRVLNQKVTKEEEREAWKKVTKKKVTKRKCGKVGKQQYSEKNWCFGQSIAHDHRGTEFYFFYSVTYQDNEKI